MKIADLSLPAIGDIVEFETDPHTVVDGVIVGETADGYIYEFSADGYRELAEACTYGKYYCSTDRKWKCRQGPKQSRNVSEEVQEFYTVVETAGYVARNSQEARDPRFSSSLTVDVQTDTLRNQLSKFFPTAAVKDGQTKISESEYQGRDVPLNKPMRGDIKKFKVYVRDPDSGNVKKVNFGHGGTSAKRLGQKTMRIRKSDPDRRRNFRARHRCHTAKDKTTARYWSCKAW